MKQFTHTMSITFCSKWADERDCMYSRVVEEEDDCK